MATEDYQRAAPASEEEKNGSGLRYTKSAAQVTEPEKGRHRLQKPQKRTAQAPEDQKLRNRLQRPKRSFQAT